MKTQDTKEKIWSGGQEIFLNAWMCVNTLISLCVAVVNINLSLAGGRVQASAVCMSDISLSSPVGACPVLQHLMESS